MSMWTISTIHDVFNNTLSYEHHQYPFTYALHSGRP